MWRRWWLRDDRTRIGDFGLALSAIDRVLEAGERVHGARWKTVAPLEHLHHAFDHAEALEPALMAHHDTPALYENVAHLATRALMLLERVERRRQGIPSGAVTVVPAGVVKR